MTRQHDPAAHQGHPAWRQRFDALVQARMCTPFQWGVHDCCLWAADSAMAVSGVDHAADLRGAYSTPMQAYRLLARHGGLRGVASRGGQAIAPLMARAGDVGLLRDSTPKLAVCAGDVWLVAGTHGLVAKPFSAAAMAWRVERA